MMKAFLQNLVTTSISYVQRFYAFMLPHVATLKNFLLAMLDKTLIWTATQIAKWLAEPKITTSAEPRNVRFKKTEWIDTKTLEKIATSPLASDGNCIFTKENREVVQFNNLRFDKWHRKNENTFTLTVSLINGLAPEELFSLNIENATIDPEDIVPFGDEKKRAESALLIPEVSAALEIRENLIAIMNSSKGETLGHRTALIRAVDSFKNLLPKKPEPTVPPVTFTSQNPAFSGTTPMPAQPGFFMYSIPSHSFVPIHLHGQTFHPQAMPYPQDPSFPSPFRW